MLDGVLSGQPSSPKRGQLLTPSPPSVSALSSSPTYAGLAFASSTGQLSSSSSSSSKSSKKAQRRHTGDDRSGPTSPVSGSHVLLASQSPPSPPRLDDSEAGGGGRAPKRGHSNSVAFRTPPSCERPARGGSGIELADGVEDPRFEALAQSLSEQFGDFEQNVVTLLDSELSIFEQQTLELNAVIREQDQLIRELLANQRRLSAQFDSLAQELSRRPTVSSVVGFVLQALLGIVFFIRHAFSRASP